MQLLIMRVPAPSMNRSLSESVDSSVKRRSCQGGPWKGEWNRSIGSFALWYSTHTAMKPRHAWGTHRRGEGGKEQPADPTAPLLRCVAQDDKRRHRMKTLG